MNINEVQIIEQKRPSKELCNFVQQRIQKMRIRMQQHGIDVIILLRPENIFYFSNFNPILISHVPYFILTKDDAFLLVHCIRHDHATNEGAIERVECYGKWGATQAVAIEDTDAMRILLGGNELTVGIEGDYISMNTLNKLSRNINVKRYVDVVPDINDLRLIKDAYEIKMCRISGELVDLGVSVAQEALKNGASEAQAATEGQYAMRNLWQKNISSMKFPVFQTPKLLLSIHWQYGACLTSA